MFKSFGRSVGRKIVRFVPEVMNRVTGSKTALYRWTRGAGHLPFRISEPGAPPIVCAG